MVQSRRARARKEASVTQAADENPKPCPVAEPYEQLAREFQSADETNRRMYLTALPMMPMRKVCVRKHGPDYRPDVSIMRIAETCYATRRPCWEMPGHLKTRRYRA